MKGLMIVGALFAALFSSSVMAWDCNYWSQSTDPHAECYKAPPSTTGGNTNKNTNTQGQGQSQGQAQAAVGVGVGTGGKSSSNSTSTGGTSNAQGGSSVSNAKGGTSNSDQQQKQSADNAGNQQISNYNSPRIPVNTAIAGIGITTAGCRFAEGLGVQTSPAGASVGFSFKDKDCSRFQLAQFLYSRGQNEAGDKVMCEIKLIKQALGSDCLFLIALPPAPLPQVAVLVTEYPPGESERRQHAHGFPRIQK